MSGKYGFELLTDQIADHVRGQMDYVASVWVHGETPIEKLFAMALATYAEFSLSQTEVEFPTGDELIKRKADPEACYLILVETQIQVTDHWRADFVLHAFFGNPPEWREIIVECDGHDFHERTKEQATRDRGRDRQAVLDGRVILRFTGHELWTDPMGCAQSVIQWIEGKRRE